jgi:DNA-binding response OmpR family regulator
MPNKKRVLVVDDEPGVLRFVKISLSMAGYEVVTASSGEEGLRLVESARPDVMLLDVFMTPFTGFDVLDRLRPASSLPVIIFTARNDMGLRAIEKGADAFVIKPFLPEQLLKKIEETLERRPAD